MRDQRFIAEHRSGPLKKTQHIQLMQWAILCTENVLNMANKGIRKELDFVLQVAKDWMTGKATVGDARKAAVRAHSIARESNSPMDEAIARSAGHAAATAHMADHSIGAGLYALKAVNIARKSVDQERKRQIDQLPPEIRELVIGTMEEKSKHFKL